MSKTRYFQLTSTEKVEVTLSGGRVKQEDQYTYTDGDLTFKFRANPNQAWTYVFEGIDNRLASKFIDAWTDTVMSGEGIPFETAIQNIKVVT